MRLKIIEPHFLALCQSFLFIRFLSFSFNEVREAYINSERVSCGFIINSGIRFFIIELIKTKT